MSMDLRIKLMRIKDLEANIEIAKKTYEEEISRLEKLQENCTHEIVIVGSSNPGYSVKAKCLFCGKHFSTPHDLRKLPNKSLLEACYCNRFEGYSEDEINSCITSMANSIVRKNSNITVTELYDELQKFLSC